MFDSGTLYICNLVDTAEPGNMPQMNFKSFQSIGMKTEW